MRQCLNYCRDSFKETVRLQLYMAENGVPITYTDTISLSELSYLFGITKEYQKEKNDSLDKMTQELNKGK